MLSVYIFINVYVSLFKGFLTILFAFLQLFFCNVLPTATIMKQVIIIINKILIKVTLKKNAIIKILIIINIYVMLVTQYVESINNVLLEMCQTCPTLISCFSFYFIAHGSWELKNRGTETSILLQFFLW